MSFFSRRIDPLSKKVIKEYAGQLGLPAFTLDYWKYIRTHSYKNAAPLPASQPYPLVLISHGMGMGRTLHVSQAENLASHGYVVAAIDHTYSTLATVFPDGHITGYLTAMDSAEDFYSSSTRIGKVWTEDIDFVIREMG